MLSRGYFFCLLRHSGSIGRCVPINMGGWVQDSRRVLHLPKLRITSVLTGGLQHSVDKAPRAQTSASLSNIVPQEAQYRPHEDHISTRATPLFVEYLCFHCGVPVEHR